MSSHLQSSLDAAEQKQNFDAQLAKAQDDAVEMKAAWDKVRAVLFIPVSFWKCVVCARACARG